MEERCPICGCRLRRGGGTYGQPTPEGRSHASKHHYVPERFFGRSANRKGSQRDGVFKTCPWGREGEWATFCDDCHEELLHNPVLLPEDIERLALLVRQRALAEDVKSESREKLAGRIELLHQIVDAGLAALLSEEP